MQSVKKIVVIGPESTGKSTLCELLAKHYQTLWCNEFAREYLLTNGTSYTPKDLLAIAKGQLELEAEMEKAVDELALKNSETGPASTPLLFVDTDMYVMKVWSEYVFGECDFFILDQIVKRKYDLYLLCDIDLAWVQDALREYPDELPRRELFMIYKDLLVNQPVPWVLISGNYEERLATAIRAVDTCLINGSVQ